MTGHGWNGLHKIMAEWELGNVKMNEIKLIGRGGQGVVIAAEMLSYALALEGKHVTAMPSFGVERRGTPVFASLRFDDNPIRELTQVYHPDCVLVMDRKQSVQLGESVRQLSGEGILILNLAQKFPQRLPEYVRTLGVVDATEIAFDEIGVGITNTCMLGAFARTTGWVGVNSIMKSLDSYFDNRLLEKNVNVVRKGYENTRVSNL